MKLSRRVEIPETATGKVHDRALYRKNANLPIYNFSAGDPKMEVHPLIENEVLIGLSKANRIVSYPPISGVSELRMLASDWMKKRYNSDYKIEETLITNGGKFGIYALISALLNPGEEVLVLAPYWVSYLPMIQVCGGVPKIVHTKEENGWKVQTEDLQRKVSLNTKLLILNNGCNPTGALYSEAEIENLLRWAKKENIFVISDEVYSEIVYDGKKFASCALFPEYRDHVAIVESCSKNFCMTGWRVGFVFASKEIIRGAAALQGQSAMSASLVSQWAAMGALKHSELISKSVLEEMKKRRDIFTSTFNYLFQTHLKQPESGIYHFISLEKMKVAHMSSSHFCEKAIEKKGIAAVEGTPFGKEGFVRFSFSEKEEEIVQGVKMLWQFCEEER